MSRTPPLRLTNPHSVLAALERRPGAVREVQLPPRGANDAWQRVAELAEAQAVAITAAPDDPAERPARSRGRNDRSDRGRRDRDGQPDRDRGGSRDRDRGGAHGRERDRGAPKDGRRGAACAFVRPVPEVPVADLFADAASRDEGHGLWLALDQVQDPRNLGAVVRSASFFGVQGVVLTRDQSAPLTAVAYDAASGGLESVPHATVTNLRRTLDTARDAGLWILGAAGEAEHDVSAVPRDRPWLLVLGNEERGLRRLTREVCDDLCRLTPRGDVDALNVSAAAAALLARLTA